MEEKDKLTETACKLVSAVPELYNDLAKPAVKEASKILSFPLELVNALLADPRRWIAERNYNLEETNALIANKLKYIEEHKLIAPPNFVAVPALQALSYSMDSSELRDLYASLLAKAMNSDTSSLVHPAYVEIIKQLSPLDAILYKHIVANIAEDGDFALYNLNIMSGEKIVKKFINIVEYQDASLNEISQSIDNLIRCGLIAVTQFVFVDFEKDEKEALLQWENLKSELSDGLTVKAELCTPVHLTELGKKFYSICCSD